jgi:hypothetical protein
MLFTESYNGGGPGMLLFFVESFLFQMDRHYYHKPSVFPTDQKVCNTPQTNIKLVVENKLSYYDVDKISLQLEY